MRHYLASRRQLVLGRWGFIFFWRNTIRSSRAADDRKSRKENIQLTMSIHQIHRTGTLRLVIVAGEYKEGGSRNSFLENFWKKKMKSFDSLPSVFSLSRHPVFALPLVSTEGEKMITLISDRAPQERILFMREIWMILGIIRPEQERRGKG